MAKIAGVTLSDDEAASLFAAFDADGTGAIAREEFVHVLRNVMKLRTITKAEVFALMDDLDTDNDGSIDFEDCRALGVLTRPSDNRKTEKQRRALLRRMPKNAKRALAKIARGPVLDPASYLSAFGAMPASFRRSSGESPHVSASPSRSALCW